MPKDRARQQGRRCSTLFERSGIQPAQPRAHTGGFCFDTCVERVARSVGMFQTCPKSVSKVFNRSRLSAGPSPNKQMGSPNLIENNMGTSGTSKHVSALATTPTLRSGARCTAASVQSVQVKAAGPVCTSFHVRTQVQLDLTVVRWDNNISCMLPFLVRLEQRFVLIYF